MAEPWPYPCPRRRCPCACTCTNISIMQLFHELKQKFPAVPDRVINECIRKNGHRNHDKEACESALEQENRAYLLHSYPPGLASKMNAAPLQTSVRCHEGCRCVDDDVLPDDEDDVPRFDRRLPGRQSLDSLCGRLQRFGRKNVTFKHHYSDEYLHRASGDDRPTSFPCSSSGRRPPMECVCCDRASAAETGSEQTHDPRGRGHESTTTETANRCGIDGNGDGKNCENHGDGGGDLRLEFASGVGSCHHCVGRASVSVSSCCGGRVLPAGPHSAPVTPSGCRPPPAFPPVSVDVTTPRHRTALSVEPAPAYAAHVDQRSRRPFTRVNLTLRPPSAEPQPPIDIQSAASGGLTYLTCSYDPHQGYRSRLQISIGRGGQGSVSAARTGSSAATLRSATSMPDVAISSEGFSGAVQSPPIRTDMVSTANMDPTTQALVRKQLEQKQRLERELLTEKENLRIMRLKVDDMEKDLLMRIDGNPSSTRHAKVQELRDEILRLQAECKIMTAEVDLSSVNPVPLGETREDFYRDIYRGPEGTCVLQPQPARESDARVSDLNSRLHRLPHQNEQTEAVSGGGAAAAAVTAGGDGPNWTCYVCTFRNHPLLEKCEQCEMPRIVLGSSSGESQNIHIHVTHHNFPSRRMAHSWVV